MKDKEIQENIFRDSVFDGIVRVDVFVYSIGGDIVN